MREAHLIMQVLEARAKLHQNLQDELGSKQLRPVPGSETSAAALACAPAMVVDEVEEAAPCAEFAHEEHIGGTQRERDPEIPNHVWVL